MADQLGSAVLTLSVDDKQFLAGLSQAQRSAERAADGLRSALGSLGVATTVGGIAAFVGNQVTQLDAASAAVRTLGVDSTELGTRLRALSIELGGNISTLELTKAAYDVASSGFASASEAADILRASALGATGGFAQVNDVASALTGVLNAYGLSASEAGRIVDQFVQTQADGVITVRQYAAEIGNVASIAAASGIKIEELNAAIATATLRGVPVAQTFTGLRQAISSIIKPSQQAAELAESLGIQFNVNALQAKGLGGVLTEVQAKTGGAADKIAILLGSVEAQAAVQPLLNDNLIKYNELLGKQAQAAGAAADASKINATTISGGLKQIGNGFSNLATTLDTTLTPLFSGFIKNINEILTKLNQVSALAPQNVQKREQEAVAAVEAQSNPLQRTGFFGGVSVKYGGKIYKGTATGVREAIVQDLLNKELQALNKSGGASATATGRQQQSKSIDSNLSSSTLSAASTFKDAANKILEASNKLADARLKLIDLQSSPTGLNKYLTPEVQQARLQQSLQSLRPAFEQAVQTASQLLQNQGLPSTRNAGTIQGANGQSVTITQPNLRIEGLRDIFTAAASGGPVSASSVQAITDFINTVQSEAQAVNNVATAQQEINQQLVQVNGSLRDQVAALVAKDWSVQVNVGADGGVSSYGQVLNQAVTP